MRKKPIISILVFAFILATAVCLTACGEERKFYYNVEEAPAHCRVELSPYAVDADGKMYANEGDGANIYVYVDDGYYSDDFKMYVNGSEVELTTSLGTGDLITSYGYSFEPKSDINVTFGGEFKPVKAEITFGTADFYDATLVSDVHIRFAQNTVGLPTSALTIPQFETATRNYKRELSYGDKLEFYVYTDGYVIDRMPMVISCDGIELQSYFYRDDAKNEYGVHYVYTQGYENKKFEIGTTWSASFTISVKENEGMGNNIDSDKLRIEYRDRSSLIITLKDYGNIPDDVLTALKLKINWQEQDINFKTGANDDGVFTVELKRPYEYFAEEQIDVNNAYKYDFDLNFYELDYFDGIEFDIFSE